MLSKTQKMALLMAFHQEAEPVTEDQLMVLASYVINAVDNKFIDWQPYIDWAVAQENDNGRTQD